MAWDKVAEQFNTNWSVRVTREQCSNKRKKLEEKFKKVREHNAMTGSDKKECEFEDELAEFFRGDPKIIPPVTVSSFPPASAGSQSTDEDKELPLKKGSAGRSRRPLKQNFDLAERMHEK